MPVGTGSGDSVGVQQAQAALESYRRVGAALGALTRLVRATADPCEPYRRYPTLLPALLGMLKSELGPELRADLLRKQA